MSLHRYRAACLFCLLGIARPAIAQDPPKADLVAPTEARTPEDERKALHLPPGFEIQLVASEPEIHKPMNMAFDDKGRLWVTSTVEYPYPAKEGTPHRDTVKVLEDIGADGKAQKVTTFAEGLNIPIGVLPLGKGALVHSIPNIYFLQDLDGDGKADSKEMYFGSIGFRDTHGMTNAFTWGFDGWIYACHGFNNESTVKGKDDKAIVMQSGNTYRLRPDGSHLEQNTWGQVNPFGLCFDPLGNLYSCDCHTRPIFQLLRGAYYDSFGKAHDGLGYGPAMMNHDHYSTGIAGINYYAADHFPPEYRDTLFVGNVVTSRINHDKIQWHGSTPAAIEQPDFLVSDDPWFRPVDIELGPDGALYIADFYNRIIGHYEVPLTHPGRDRERGRIWRIIYRGPDGKTPPPTMPRADWAKATVDELIGDLSHPNITVRTKATNQLALRGGDDVVQGVTTTIKSAPSNAARSHALWALQRIGKLDTATLKHAAADSDRTVRVHAMRVLSERPDWNDEESSLARNGLQDPDPNVIRAAADALGRHPSGGNLKPLLTSRHAAPAEDTHLVHVIRMALRDQLLPGTPWPKVAKDGGLSEADVRALADVAPGSHGPESADFLVDFVKTYREFDDGALSRCVHHVSRYGSDRSIDAIIEFVRTDAPENLRRQAGFLKSIQRGMQERGVPMPESARAIGSKAADALLRSKDRDEIAAGVDLASSFQVKDAQPALVALLKNREIPDDLRLATMTTLMAIDADGSVPSIREVLVDAGQPIGVREAAAAKLGNLNHEECRTALVDALPLAPSRLQTAIAVGLAPSRPGAEALLKAIQEGKASPRLLQDRPVQVVLAGSNVPDLEKRLAELTAGLPPAEERVQQLLIARRKGLAEHPGDAERGAKVFQKICAACHQIGGQGAKVGPQLDGVGIRGADRLLEDVLDPNRNVDQAFRSSNIAQKDGSLVSGLVLREEGEIVVVADAQGKEIRVPKDTIDERVVSALSPMPANLAEQIAEPEFDDLMAYLLSQTFKAK